jgi:hypothetical protein
MSKVILDAATQAKLNGLNQELELCDEAGKRLGYFLPDDLYAHLMCAIAKAEVTDEELEEARRDYQQNGGLTTAEVLAHLERFIRERKRA